MSKLLKIIFVLIFSSALFLAIRFNNVQKAQTLEPGIPNNSLNLQTEPQHFAYDEASLEDLIIVSSYAQDSNQRYERLNLETGKALMRMIYAARDDNVWLVPVSGFRSIEAQKLLFSRQLKLQGSIASAKRISAPPGYSEHHTGYSIDLTDGNFPEQDLTVDFVNTPAYSWLIYRAKDFGFELSFPENNSQKVSFEPWHWRFVGTPIAKTIFEKARN